MLCKTLITIRLLLHLCCFHTVEGAVPSFTVPLSTTSPGSVDEHSSSDVSILTVEGQDTDGDTLLFSLVSQTPSSPPFLLDSNSGLLKTPAGLDAEFSLIFIFTFGVTDGLTTVNSVTYTVNINDINEFMPVFQGTPYSASLLDSVSNGYQVITVNATDEDATATVTYSLISGNSPVTFSLDSSTGLITVSDSTQLDPTSTPYSLNIQASDGTNTVIVTVSITVNEDFCSPTPCANSGTCSLTGNSHTCTCTLQYTGQNCTQEDFCSPIPCANSGTCSLTGSSYTCTCTSQYTGQNCTQEDFCSPTPCANSGTCSLTGNSHTCTCTSQYTGQNCTQEDFCSPSPCANSGTCSLTGSSYTCTCTSQYTGQNCTQEDFCSPTPCANSGTCSLTGNSHTCTCTSQYTGQNCTQEDFCSPIPCANSGTCSLTGSSYTCTCTSQYTGQNCTQVSGTDEPKYGTGLIVGVTIAMVVLVFLLIGIAVYTRKKMKYRRKIDEIPEGKFIRSEFRAMDTDNNGVLSKQQVLNLLTVLGHNNGVEIFKADVTLYDYVNMFMLDKTLLSKTSRCRKEFKSFDKNNDEKASTEEIINWLKSKDMNEEENQLVADHDKKLKEEVNELGAVNGGKITYEQYVKCELKIA